MANKKGKKKIDEAKNKKLIEVYKKLLKKKKKFDHNTRKLFSKRINTLEFEIVRTQILKDMVNDFNNFVNSLDKILKISFERQKKEKELEGLKDGAKNIN